MGISDRAVRNIISKLKKKKILDVDVRFGFSNRYWFGKIKTLIKKIDATKVKTNNEVRKKTSRVDETTPEENFHGSGRKLPTKKLLTLTRKHVNTLYVNGYDVVPSTEHVTQANVKSQRERVFLKAKDQKKKPTESAQESLHAGELNIDHGDGAGHDLDQRKSSTISAASPDADDYSASEFDAEVDKSVQRLLASSPPPAQSPLMAMLREDYKPSEQPESELQRKLREAADLISAAEYQAQSEIPSAEESGVSIREDHEIFTQEKPACDEAPQSQRAPANTNSHNDESAKFRAHLGQAKNEGEFYAIVDHWCGETEHDEIAGRIARGLLYIREQLEKLHRVNGGCDEELFKNWRRHFQICRTLALKDQVLIVARVFGEMYESAKDTPRCFKFPGAVYNARVIKYAAEQGIDLGSKMPNAKAAMSTRAAAVNY